MKQLYVALCLGLITWVGQAQQEIPAAVEQARAKAERGDRADAIRDLERLLESPDAPVIARELLGALYLQAGRPGDALALLEPLTEGDAPDPVVLFNVARALHDLGRTQEGERYLVRSVELAPRSRATVQLARLRAGAGAHNEAVRLLEPMAVGAVAEALERDDPGMALEVTTVFASALLELGERQRAVPHLERVTRLAPSQPGAWERLGKVLVELDRPDEAYATLSRAQSLAESQRAAEIEGAARAERLLREAKALQGSGRLEEALAAVRQAQEAAPREPDAWLLEVRLLIDLRRDDEALHAAERLVTRTSGHQGSGSAFVATEALFLRASARLAVRDPESAEEDFRRVLEKRPDHSAAINSLALILMFTDRLEEAEALLLELLADSPGDPIAMENLARIRQRSR